MKTTYLEPNCYVLTMLEPQVICASNLSGGAETDEFVYESVNSADLF